MNNTVKTNNTLLEDLGRVTRVVAEVNDTIASFTAKSKLLSEEKNLLAYCNAVGQGSWSPEGMSDPENLQKRQARFQTNFAKLQVISEFKNDLLSGKFTTDLDLQSHPTYFEVLGRKIYLGEHQADSFLDLHPDVLSYMLGVVSSVDLILHELNNAGGECEDSTSDEPDGLPQCDGNCSNCSSCGRYETESAEPTEQAEPSATKPYHRTTPEHVVLFVPKTVHVRNIWDLLRL